MYELIISNNVKKEIKKLDKSVIKKAIEIFDEISENPFSGIQLKGDLYHLLKTEFRLQGVSYRIVYEVFREAASTLEMPFLG